MRIGLAIFCISVLDTCVEKNATSHNITKQPISKDNKLIEDNSNYNFTSKIVVPTKTISGSYIH